MIPKVCDDAGRPQGSVGRILLIIMLESHGRTRDPVGSKLEDMADLLLLALGHGTCKSG